MTNQSQWVNIFSPGNLQPPWRRKLIRVPSVVKLKDAVKNIWKLSHEINFLYWPSLFIHSFNICFESIWGETVPIDCGHFWEFPYEYIISSWLVKKQANKVHICLRCVLDTASPGRFKSTSRWDSPYLCTGCMYMSMYMSVYMIYVSVYVCLGVHDDVIKWKHFCVTGHLCRESPVTGEFLAQRPVTRSFDVFFDMHLNKPLSKQWWGWWFETLSCPLWRHCNGWVYSARVEVTGTILINTVVADCLPLPGGPFTNMG